MYSMGPYSLCTWPPIDPKRPLSPYYACAPAYPGAILSAGLSYLNSPPSYNGRNEPHALLIILNIGFSTEDGERQSVRGTRGFRSLRPQSPRRIYGWRVQLRLRAARCQ